MPVLQRDVLYQEIAQGGWSLVWYGLNGETGGGCDCSDVFTPRMLHLVFNLSGQGMVMGGRTRLGLMPSTLAMCFPRGKVSATRLPGSGNHEFVVLSITSGWLKKLLGDRGQSIYPALWDSISGRGDEGKPLGHLRSMSLAEKDMAQQLSDPPVEEAALPFWYAAKVTEIIALHLFRPMTMGGVAGNAEPFCTQRKRLAGERVDKVTLWLEQHLDEPLELKKLAQHVGCAPHYLSRLFSKETGRTLSQYLRAIRIEEAARLMDSGRFNVTEAAMEVGYNSLSHFTKAFVVEKGVKPSAYLSRGDTYE